MASGWNLCVVRMYRCGYIVSVVRRYIDILIIIIPFPTPLVLALFWAAPSLFLFILKIFFHSCLCYFCAML